MWRGYAHRRLLEFGRIPDQPKLGRYGEIFTGVFRLGTGFWLMYLTYAVVLNFVLNYGLPL